MTDEKVSEQELLDKIADEQSALDGNPNQAMIIESLQAEISTLKDRRNEERFFLFVLIVLLFNVIIVENIENIGTALIILIPEGVLLLIAAYTLGIDVIFTLIQNYINYKKEKK